MVTNRSRTEAQVAGMDLVHERMAILTHLNSPGVSICTQGFMKQDELFAEMEKVKLN